MSSSHHPDDTIFDIEVCQCGKALLLSVLDPQHRLKARSHFPFEGLPALIDHLVGIQADVDAADAVIPAGVVIQ
jgi:hypothetical protein